MEYKIVPILSSREFYKMLDVLNEIMISEEICILDFTNISRIDAVVIPNLLLLGKLIEKKTKNIPYIRLGEDLNSGYLKKYLINIGFYKISESFFYYENELGKYGGLLGKEMDNRNTTEQFAFKDGITLAKRKLYYSIYPFIKGYFKKFHMEYTDSEGVLDDNTFKNNLIAKFLEEMISNSFKYGECDVIITVQSNYKKQKIYLSVSDYGNGFLPSVVQCMDEKGEFIKREQYAEPGHNILNKKPTDELEAIIIGIYKRRYSRTYGLFNVIRNVLELQGTIRIHSNNRQIILTNRLIDKFIDGTLIKDIKHVMGYNIMKTSQFNGVHIEVELPLTFSYKEEF